MTLHSQRGGTFLGLVIGLVIGLAVALGVAMYVTKVSTPFSSKNLTRTPEQDSAEAEKNKDWNPNAILQPKAPASTPEAPVAEGAAKDSTGGTAAVSKPPVDKPPAVNADPLGDLAKNKGALSTPAPTGGQGNDPFSYFVQVGAFRTPAEAEAQRAKLMLIGLEAKVSEREQGGRTVYRVRIGPIDDKDAAERLKSRVDSNGMETALVRVQK